MAASSAPNLQIRTRGHGSKVYGLSIRDAIACQRSPYGATVLQLIRRGMADRRLSRGPPDQETPCPTNPSCPLLMGEDELVGHHATEGYRAIWEEASPNA